MTVLVCLLLLSLGVEPALDPDGVQLDLSLNLRHVILGGVGSPRVIL